jgi:predicted nuclease of predicted toxin-antitoxin system
VTVLLGGNLSPRLIDQLSDAYPGAAHVHHCGLSSTNDAAIWESAKGNGVSIPLYQTAAISTAKRWCMMATT